VESVEDATTYAAENEIPLAGAPFLKGGAVFLPVDSASTLLDQFYTWNETRPDEQPMRTVWRPFIWITANNSDSDVWGTNVHLKDVLVGNGLSVFQIITD
jgi:Tfp pilus assembly protein PilZ